MYGTVDSGLGVELSLDRHPMSSFTLVLFGSRPPFSVLVLGTRCHLQRA